jgi:hypothetical protein
MFQIRVFTPPLTNENGWPHAGGVLSAGETRLHFRIDLRFWRVPDYERQWRVGIARLVHGASSSALMTAFAGAAGPHFFWALWKEGGRVYVQPQCVTMAELEQPFNPFAPYDLVGTRLPVTENQLPLLETRVPFEQLIAANFRIGWPLGQ